MTESTAFWDRLAERYSRQKLDDPAAWERTLTATGEYLTPESRVLELGCGTGSTAIRLAPLSGPYLATDISPAMIAIAEKKRRAAKLHNLALVAAVAEDPRLEPGEFDVILGFNYIHLVPDVAATLKRIHELIAPGGVFISKGACILDINRFLPVVIRLMKLVGKAPDTVHAFHASELEQMIRDAGFVIENVAWHGTPGKKDTRPFIVARKA